MRITSITAENFKTFSCESINFENLSIFVGANASGKSNTISLFRFISNIIRYGLDPAISLLGGIDYVTNVSLPRTTPLHIRFSLDLRDQDWVRVIDRKSGVGFLLSEVVCDFKLQKYQRMTKNKSYRIIEDSLDLKYLSVSEDYEKEVDIVDENSTCTVSYTRHKKSVISTIINNTSHANEYLNSKLGSEFLEQIMTEDFSELILNKLDFLMHPTFDPASFIKIYDFDPKLMKKSSSLIAKKSLEEDGSNLANILQGILANEEDKELFLNLLSESLPFIEHISLENNFDKSLSYSVKEKFSDKKFNSIFLSHGTVSIIAFITALYFEKYPGIIIIEEPERNIHPKLMSKVVEMAKEKSEDIQVIITTHNPELIKSADLSSIFLNKRCNEGFTSITKPNDSKQIHSFIENDLGVDYLFVQDMLGE